MSTTLSIVLLIIAILSLIGSIIWSLKEKGWEPRIAVLASISGIIYLIVDLNKPVITEPESKQKIEIKENQAGNISGNVENQNITNYNYDTTIFKQKIYLENEKEKLENEIKGLKSTQTKDKQERTISPSNTNNPIEKPRTEFIVCRGSPYKTKITNTLELVIMFSDFVKDRYNRNMVELKIYLNNIEYKTYALLKDKSQTFEINDKIFKIQIKDILEETHIPCAKIDYSYY